MASSSSQPSSKLNNCRICLKQILAEKKGVITTCMHEFCFKCIVKHAKRVKPQCPICWRRFKSVWRRVDGRRKLFEVKPTNFRKNDPDGERYRDMDLYYHLQGVETKKKEDTKCITIDGSDDEADGLWKCRDKRPFDNPVTSDSVILQTSIDQPLYDSIFQLMYEGEKEEDDDDYDDEDDYAETTSSGKRKRGNGGDGMLSKRMKLESLDWSW
ncbi:hypothetical protein HELRODRAFT_163575 [Helobdella robusta]|uniref:RING-type E3 ubiquitin transferase n=1 Tax=Helobdella robusta TaxID=6412 RepID=T1EU84_HELRO|nr:hypothetical protein HELRODRAFT_163575 [Helobdella robusta]ESN96506.1 hypothetical protein HELRODRAFT_163575 [Helobdella robusta]